MDDVSNDEIVHPNHEKTLKNGLQECVGKSAINKNKEVDGNMALALLCQNSGSNNRSLTPCRNALIGHSAYGNIGRPGGKNTRYCSLVNHSFK